MHQERADNTANPTSRAVVLCYHSHRFRGSRYQDNDRIALAEDLELIRSLGLDIIPARQLVEALCGERPWSEVAGRVVITFDDGLCLDYRDHQHPSLGLLPSLLRQLESFDACATSFVIASPDARRILEGVAFDGEPMLEDDWWSAAAADGRLEIGNHSWDHNHACLPWRGPGITAGGAFHLIDNEAAARWQVEQSQRYLAGCLDGCPPALFAYPHGESSRYLVTEYMPARGSALGLKGAFVTGGAPVLPDTPRWCIPRFVCGKHWTSADALAQILLDESGVPLVEPS